MQLSDRTLSILRNYSQINQSIILEDGNKIKTIANDQAIVSYAAIKEHIPGVAPIYDLHRFLSAHKMLTEPDLDFNDNNITLTSSSGSNVLEYRLTVRDMIRPVPEEVEEDDEIYAFSLTADELKTIQNAAKTLQLPDLVISKKDNTIVASITTADEESSDNFKIVLAMGQDIADIEFDPLIISIENFRVMPLDYTVVLYETMVKMVYNDDVGEIKYYITCKYQG